MKKFIILAWLLLPCIVFAQEKEYSFNELLIGFHSNKLSRGQLLSFALKAKEIHQDSIGRIAALKFKKKYLANGNFRFSLNPDLQPLLDGFPNIFGVNDPLVKYMSKNQKKTDAALATPGISIFIIKNAITSDIINPLVYKNGKFQSEEPNWQIIEKKVRTYADSKTTKTLLINTKFGWYKAKNDWPNIVRCQIERIDHDGIDTEGLAGVMLNNIVYYEIFKYGDLPALNKGLSYMKLLLKHNPNEDAWIDTYANLLYKLGNTTEAMKHEQRALDIAKTKKNRDREKEYIEVLDKMGTGQPTW
ncbi:MAG: hypothetical protein V4594_03085 [Bacteroidota bacterium]